MIKKTPPSEITGQGFAFLSNPLLPKNHQIQSIKKRQSSFDDSKEFTSTTYSVNNSGSHLNLMSRFKLK